MRSLYRSPLNFSMSCFIATNSAPKTEVSSVACFLEIQPIIAMLQKIRKPVRECLVHFSPVWALSPNRQMSRSLPKGSGMSCGIVSIVGEEGRDVNFGVGRVKDKVRVMFLLEVSHRVESSFEVAFMGISKM